MTERTQENCIVSKLLLFLELICLPPHNDLLLLFFSHWAYNVFAKNLLRADVKGALAFHRNELNAVVHGHDISRDKLILRTTTKFLKTEFKADLILDSSLEVCPRNSLGVHLEQRENSLYNLCEFFAAVYHLSGRAIPNLLWEMLVAEHRLEKAVYLGLILTRLISLFVHEEGKRVIYVAKFNFYLVSHRLKQIF